MKKYYYIKCVYYGYIVCNQILSMQELLWQLIKLKSYEIYKQPWDMFF